MENAEVLAKILNALNGIHFMMVLIVGLLLGWVMCWIDHTRRG